MRYHSGPLWPTYGCICN
ncbi:hypothetical protein LINGRAHAP2_LOCUS23926 [Linum grandiflorum]